MYLANDQQLVIAHNNAMTNIHMEAICTRAVLLKSHVRLFNTKFGRDQLQNIVFITVHELGLKCMPEGCSREI